MRHLGHPLLGDKMYMLEKYAETASLLPEDKLQRQALHAYKLGFLHPGTREPVEFAAPLPEDLINLKDWLRCGQQ
jgi:23S rRNA pseudouridine1911/1915/1917 synthase